MHEAFAQAFDFADPVFKSLRSGAAAVATSAIESDGNVFEISGQVRMHAHTVVFGHVSSFQQFNSGSCIEVDDCHGSSCNVASTGGDEGEKKEELLQFFVNCGKGSMVVRCSPHSMVSHVVHYGCEEYAVCGTRTLKSGDAQLQNGIENGMTVRVLRRLRGGAGGYANVDILGQCECSFCHAIRCWPTRKRCYRCDIPRDFSIPNFVDHWAGRPNRCVTMCLRRGVLGQGHRLFHHGT